MPPKTDPSLLLGLYTAEAERINRWINIGFGGLVKAAEEKGGQIKEYETAIKKWDTECKAIIAAQDEDVTETTARKKRFGLF